LPCFGEFEVVVVLVEVISVEEVDEAAVTSVFCRGCVFGGGSFFRSRICVAVVGATGKEQAGGENRGSDESSWAAHATFLSLSDEAFGNGSPRPSEQRRGLTAAPSVVDTASRHACAFAAENTKRPGTPTTGTRPVDGEEGSLRPPRQAHRPRFPRRHPRRRR